jgi:hypothetical protein
MQQGLKAGFRGLAAAGHLRVQDASHVLGAAAREGAGQLQHRLTGNVLEVVQFTSMLSAVQGSST